MSLIERVFESVLRLSLLRFYDAFTRTALISSIQSHQQRHPNLLRRSFSLILVSILIGILLKYTHARDDKRSAVDPQSIGAVPPEAAPERRSPSIH
jgi:hypothetical protein